MKKVIATWNSSEDIPVPSVHHAARVSIASLLPLSLERRIKQD
jgi:hypothetical protein